MGYHFSKRSRDAMVGVHPDLVRVAERAIELTRYDFIAAEGVRGEARQRWLVEQGWSHTMQSKHLLQEDGYGHALDVVACGDLDGDGDIDAQDKALVWNRFIYTCIADAFKQAAEELCIPIRWGGDFKSWFDGPHFELITT